MFANLVRRCRCSRAPMRLPSIWLGQRSPETCCSSCRMGASTDCAKSCCKSSALRDRFQARPKPGELYFRPETFSRAMAISSPGFAGVPDQHLFHVTMTIPDVKGVVTVQMAAWNALYQIRDFSAHVQQLEAFAGAEKAAIEKLDKQTWRIQGSGTITVRYATYWDEIGPFGTQLNAEHAFINPAMILLYIPDRRAENVVLSIPNPPENWRAASATGIESPGGARTFFFKAATYDDFADGPIEIGNFQEVDLPGVSPRVTVLVHGEKWRRKLIEEDLKRICEYETKLMEGAPFEHYTFLLHIGKGAPSMSFVSYSQIRFRSSSMSFRLH